MRDMLDFRLTKFMGVIFTPELNISNSLKIANDAFELLGDWLDGSSTVLPIPQNAPAEIPRVQLESRDKKWNLSISLVRTNFIHSTAVEDTEVLTVEEFGTIASNFFRGFKKRNDLRVQRLAFITERIALNTEANYIVNKFCKDELSQKGRPFSGIKSFQVHSFKKYSQFGYNINSWVRFKSGDYSTGPESSVPMILMENDLNTFAVKEDPNRSFSLDEIEMFFKQIPNHLRKIVELYSF